MTDSKPYSPHRPVSATALLRLADDDPHAAQAALSALGAERVAEAVLDLQPADREALLALVPEPEKVVPLLPEAELAGTLRAVGLDDAAWLLEFATPEQRVACLDLDCWRDARLSHRRLSEWMNALVVAGPRALLAGLEDFDPELWVLALREMADLEVVKVGEEPPAGYFTEDGVVWYLPHSDADFDRIRELFCTAISESPRRYWQLVYGVIFESPAECEEYALRWHRARLNDLGFPDRERAIRAYAPLQVDETPVLEVPPREGDVVPTGQVPQRLAGTLVGRALAELPADRAADVLGYVLGVANALAIADGLRLADPATGPRALRKAVTGIDRGLEALARARSQPAHRVLDATRPMDLFRIGATLDRDLRPLSRTLGDLDAEDPSEDWDIETEVLDPENP